MVKPADTVPPGEPTCTWYAPDSTCGRAVESRSPGVTASTDTGNESFTVVDRPGSRLTRANATNRCGGTTTSDTGWCTYTGTTSVPARGPVLVTVNVTSTEPLRDTVPVAASPPVENVVYDRPKPNGNRGLYACPCPDPVSGNWSK